jgi:hypothetical protein
MKIEIPNEYLPIWQAARPYYERGRSMDINHIEWMMPTALSVCAHEPQVDQSLLLPTVILHDVGYAEVEHDNYYHLDTRRAHMARGADIARTILTELAYDPEIVAKVVYYISVHDNWAFGELDLYRNDLVLGVFKDLDWLWTLTPEGFKSVRDNQKYSLEEMMTYISNPETKKPPEYATRTTDALFHQYLADRVKEYTSSSAGEK